MQFNNYNLKRSKIQALCCEKPFLKMEYVFGINMDLRKVTITLVPFLLIITCFGRYIEETFILDKFDKLSSSSLNPHWACVVRYSIRSLRRADTRPTVRFIGVHIVQ